MAEQPELGVILTGNEGRDAVHIAIAPVIASHRLAPGSHVGFVTGSTIEVTASADETIGIIDPLLQRHIAKGERCWLWLYPKSITTLRHVWSHPAFKEETSELATLEQDGVIVREQITGIATRERIAAIERLTSFAKNDCCGASYQELIDAANNWLDNGEHWYGPNHAFSGGESIYSEFWNDYETATGRRVMSRNREDFFTCSC